MGESQTRRFVVGSDRLGFADSDSPISMSNFDLYLMFLRKALQVEFLPSVDEASTLPLFVRHRLLAARLCLARVISPN